VITNLPQQTNAGLAKAFFGAWARVLLRMLSPVIARSDSDEAIQFLPRRWIASLRSQRRSLIKPGIVFL
jgi:hypothetical protein